MTDADGRPVVLVTGSTSGIGRAAARYVGEAGARVFVHGRHRENGERIADEISDETDGTARFLAADFADPDAVRGLATVVREECDRLDALVNNAGASIPERRVREVGADGTPVEETFVVNHLAPYLLTRELVDLLRAGAPSRVVVTASGVHVRGDLALEDLTLSDYDALDAYARSKLANVLFARELAERFDPETATANAMHPGFVPGSGLYRNVGGWFRLATRIAGTLPLVGTSVEAAGRDLAYLTVSDAVGDVTGAYFDGRERATPDGRADDEALRDRLWTTSADLVGIDPDWP